MAGIRARRVAGAKGRPRRAGGMILSAGAVVCRRRGRRREYLLLKNARGHWDFPKGKLEEHERSLAAMYRETREETGLTDLELVPGFLMRLRWRYREGGRMVAKQAEYYLAHSAGRRVRLSREHRTARWVGIDEGLRCLSFANARRLLRTADLYLGRRA